MKKLILLISIIILHHNNLELQNFRYTIVMIRRIICYYKIQINTYIVLK